MTFGAMIVLALSAASAMGVPAPNGCRAGPALVVQNATAVVAVYRVPDGGAAVCLQSGAGAGGASGESTAASEDGARVPPHAVQVFSEAMSGDPGLEVLYGRVGTRVTAITIMRSNHRPPVHARVGHGWYVALWSGLAHRVHATTVRIAAGSMTRTFPLPAAARQGIPRCGGSPASVCLSAGPGQTVGR